MEDDFLVIRAVALYHNGGRAVYQRVPNRLPSAITRPRGRPLDSNGRCGRWPISRASQDQSEGCRQA
jgi:hypothetical protein